MIQGSRNHFSIRMCPEPVPRTHQLAAQFLVVVNLAVEYNVIAPISRRHRLRSADEIDDGQSAMAEAHTGSHPDAFSVRPSVAQGCIHVRQDSFSSVRRQLAPISCYSAHDLTSVTSVKLRNIIHKPHPKTLWPQHHKCCLTEVPKDNPTFEIVNRNFPEGSDGIYSGNSK